MSIATTGVLLPGFPPGGIQWSGHKAILSRRTAGETITKGFIQSRGGSQSTTRHLKPPHQSCQHGSTPAALVGTPAIADSFTQHDSYWPKWKHFAIHINCFTNTGIVQKFIGNPADGYYAIETIQRTGGWAEDATDEEIVEAIKLLAETEASSPKRRAERPWP